jgi:glycosyltransferase involved in cell wall biosynthesis
VPRFSVVIAAYNSAAWIVTTVRSALRQTLRAEEIIVVGDGCTDATGDILATHFLTRCAGRTSRGTRAAVDPNNEGIRLARGTHIAYLGHDDVWSPHHLERLAGVVAGARSGLRGERRRSSTDRPDRGSTRSPGGSTIRAPLRASSSRRRPLRTAATSWTASDPGASRASCARARTANSCCAP